MSVSGSASLRPERSLRLLRKDCGLAKNAPGVLLQNTSGAGGSAAPGVWTPPVERASVPSRPYFLSLREVSIAQNLTAGSRRESLRGNWVQRREASSSSFTSRASPSPSLPLPSFATVSFQDASLRGARKGRVFLERGEEVLYSNEAQGELRRCGESKEALLEDSLKDLEVYAERALEQGHAEELQRRVLLAASEGSRLSPRLLAAFAEAARTLPSPASTSTQGFRSPLNSDAVSVLASAAAAAAVSAVRASQGQGPSGKRPFLEAEASDRHRGPAHADADESSHQSSPWMKRFRRLLPGVGASLKTVGRGLFRAVLSPVTAVLLLLGGAAEISKQLGGALGSSSSTSWLKEKRADAESIEDSFDSVKGHAEVKRELKEVIEYLKNPEKFTDIGARLPKGVLLHGPPGTGKTLLARAIAGEAGVPFLHASGSDFDEVFVGVGASRVRALFAEARKLGRCVIFIDEIDALAGSRRTPENATFRQTLNQLLSELDGFKQNEGIVLICATNLLGSVDAALLRPGRVDRIIHVPPPCRQERVELLAHYGSRLRLAKDFDVTSFAGLTSGLTGADIANLLNWAAIRAACSAKEEVSRGDVEESFDRLKVGNARSAAEVRLQEKTITAFHEGGHALMCLSTRLAPDLHKASILFRGDALGVTWEAPGEEKYSETLGEALDRLKVLLAGKAAEEVAFGGKEVTMGCLSDLQKATRLAVDLVTSFGVGLDRDDGDKDVEASNKAAELATSKRMRLFEGLGKAADNPTDSEAFSLGGDSGFCLQALDGRQLSEGMRSRVEAAAKRLLDAAFRDAVATLTEKKEELQRIAQALLHYETLTADEIKAAAAGTLELKGEPAYKTADPDSSDERSNANSGLASQSQLLSRPASESSQAESEHCLKKNSLPFRSQENPYGLQETAMKAAF